MILEMTSELRRKLLEKRQALGITRHELAGELGVNTLTVKRWEEGPTMSCIHALSSLITDFLEGKYDERFPATKAHSLKDREHETLKEQLRALTLLYLEAREHPRVRKHILEGLQRISSASTSGTPETSGHLCQKARH